jgi:hypothetical protein
MHAAVRPWFATGVALASASVIAVAPVAPPPPAVTPHVYVPQVRIPDVQLSASIVDILTFPALRQSILNRIDDIVTLGVGLAGSAAGLGRAIGAVPETLRTVAQQVLSGDLLGALTTIETALVASIVAVGGPTLAAIIERRESALAVREALQTAAPQAFFEFVGGFGRAADEVLRAFIVAGQGLVDAVLSFSPGAIVGALVDGTTLVLGSFVDGGQHVVDGIVSAQQTLATALAAEPTTSVTAVSANVSSADVTDVPDLSRKSAMVAVSTPTDATDAPETDGAATSSATTTEEKPAKSEAPKTDEDKDAASPPAGGKPDETSPESPKNDTEKKDAESPKKEPKKAGEKSEAEGAKEK